MISINSGLVLVIVVIGSSLVVNSEFEASQPQANAPLCRIVRNIRKNLLQEFQSHIKNSELVCDIQDGCQSTNCTYNDEKSIAGPFIEGGYKLSICEKSPFVQFWVRVWNQTEMYNVTVKNETQRIKIIHNNDGGRNNNSSQHWYLRIMLNKNKNQAREQIPSDVYLTLTLTFEVWNVTSQTEKPFLEINIMNDTRFYPTQLCASDGPQNLQLHESSSLAQPPLHKLKMLTQDNNDAWKQEDLHINVKRTSSIPSQIIGAVCQGIGVSECGPEATCHLNGQNGICECLPGYTEKNGSCVSSESHVDPTVQPFPSASNSATAYSSALAALLAVIVLVSIAAAMFFGTKYRVFSRVRSRISLHMPFRNNRTSIDDQGRIGMTDPFANDFDDDDDPPLL